MIVRVLDSDDVSDWACVPVCVCVAVSDGDCDGVSETLGVWLGDPDNDGLSEGVSLCDGDTDGVCVAVTLRVRDIDVVADGLGEAEELGLVVALGDRVCEGVGEHTNLRPVSITPGHPAESTTQPVELLHTRGATGSAKPRAGASLPPVGGIMSLRITGTSGTHETRWNREAVVSMTKLVSSKRGVNWASEDSCVKTGKLPTLEPTVPVALS